MRRSEVWWVAFDPALGGETRKTRPAVIVSADPANLNLNRVTVVPTTSAIGRLYPSEVVVSVAGRQSKAVADQIRTVSKARLRTRLGTINDAEMESLEAAIRVHLALT